ncbi:MAG: hypothetical protein D6705_13905 [Deltaproteobacteria bacterium]|nr:MAG: hypothetical protein D6705_13905 [Deltaproteobacteria bacterium]
MRRHRSHPIVAVACATVLLANARPVAAAAWTSPGPPPGGQDAPAPATDPTSSTADPAAPPAADEAEQSGDGHGGAADPGRTPAQDTARPDATRPEGAEADASGSDEAANAPSLAQLYARGEGAFEAGDFDTAVEAFATGLARTSRDPNVPPRIRAHFRVSLGIALWERFKAKGEQHLADLEAARKHLAAAIEEDAEALTADPTLEALARRNLDAVNRALEARRPPPPPRVVRVTEPGVDATLLRRARKDRRAGIGLLVGGTAVIAGGVAILVDGLTLEARARAIAEDPPMGRQKEYIEQEVPRLQRIRYAIAGPALALGTALVGAGIGLLVRARRTAAKATR